MKGTENTVRVWDPIVRIGHWSLVFAFFTAYFTEDDLLTQHVWAGYVAGAVVCIRLLWGFVGTRHARFTDFVRSPAVTLGYTRDVIGKRAKRYIGHNPAGGAMVIALLISISATVLSGLVLYAVEEDAGPLAAWVAAPSAPLSLSANAYVDDDERGYGAEHEEDDSEELWEEIHEFLTDLTLLLVGLHVAGVLYSGHAHKENLIKAMITGRKEPLDQP